MLGPVDVSTDMRVQLDIYLSCLWYLAIMALGTLIEVLADISSLTQSTSKATKPLSLTLFIASVDLRDQFYRNSHLKRSILLRNFNKWRYETFVSFPLVKLSTHVSSQTIAKSWFVQPLQQVETLMICSALFIRQGHLSNRHFRSLLYYSTTSLFSCILQHA